MGDCDDFRISGQSFVEIDDARQMEDRLNIVGLESGQQQAMIAAEGHSHSEDANIESLYTLISSRPRTFCAITGSFHTGDDERIPELKVAAIANLVLAGLDEEYERTLQSDIREEIHPNDNQASDVGCLTESVLEHTAVARSCHVARGEPKEAARDPFLFVADWNRAPSCKNVRSVEFADTDAVRRAVQEINGTSRESPFQRRFAEWTEHLEMQNCAHQVIPRAPFNAFKRSSQKAKLATASLTRSASIAEALLRLHHYKLLDSTRNDIAIDVVGVDHVECESIERVQKVFRPIVRWIGTWKAVNFHRLHFRLIGRDLSSAVSGKCINLLTPDFTTNIVKAEATCHSEICYHDWKQHHQEWPAMMIAFNAGIWGYKEWIPTILFLASQERSVPMVITAYTLEEAEEDMEVIRETVPGNGASVLWDPETNPFGSKIIRETTSSSREYRENSSWQAWKFGKDDPSTSISKSRSK
eukprot:scaffold22577_cov122-Cylindrotheca_fusiformis.AAC.26